MPAPVPVPVPVPVPTFPLVHFDVRQLKLASSTVRAMDIPDWLVWIAVGLVAFHEPVTRGFDAGFEADDL
ncbi:hypothetical protein ACFVVP_26920 [Streptomyces sp. NPDC058128]|uniref:hypothetical protein n=1 Tax=Streptomyces sp. NPDC058128 TaxID=3346352 RepID=UPI0036ED0064